MPEIRPPPPGSPRVRYPGASPVRYPGASPVRYPGASGVRYPGASPVQYPGASGVRYPGASPVRYPGASPGRSPGCSPVRYPGRTRGPALLSARDGTAIQFPLGTAIQFRPAKLVAVPFRLDAERAPAAASHKLRPLRTRQSSIATRHSPMLSRPANRKSRNQWAVSREL